MHYSKKKNIKKTPLPPCMGAIIVVYTIVSHPTY